MRGTALGAAVLAATALVALESRSSASSRRAFVWGVSVSSGGADMAARLDPAFVERVVARLREGGFGAVRYELTWRDCESIGPGHPALGLIARLRAAGIQVIPVVGVGTKGALPRGVRPDDAPEQYIARVSAHVEELSRSLAPFGLTRFQLENELNAAGLATSPLYSWRDGKAWFDFEWKTRLLRALAVAVKKYNPRAIVYTNFHDVVTDPERSPHSPFESLAIARSSPARLARVLERWGPILDEVGLDFYPNYVLPWIGDCPASVLPPDYLLAASDPGRVLAARVAWYRSVAHRPVLIAETGYPSWSPLHHSPSLQREFVRSIAAAAPTSGATGLVYFRLNDSKPPPLWERFPWDPNKSIEPFFGLLDDRLEPKRFSLRVWGEPERQLSSWEALAEAIRSDATK